MTQHLEPAATRRVLLLAHTGRAEAREVARAFVESLSGHGVHVRLMAQEAADLKLKLFELTGGDDAAGGL